MKLTVSFRSKRLGCNSSAFSPPASRSSFLAWRSASSSKVADLSEQAFRIRSRARVLELELAPAPLVKIASRGNARRTQESGGEQLPVSRNPHSCIGSERLISVQTRKASRQRQNCARNLECDSRGLTSTVKICTRTQYVGLAEQCQQTLAGPAMNFGAGLALAVLKA